jgi:hypothetical protein
MHVTNATTCVPRAGEPGGVCSGRGLCLLDSNNRSAYCACEYPFANRGDFAIDPSVDCGINTIAVKVLWGITTLSTGVLLLLALRLILLSGLSSKFRLTSVERICTYLCSIYAVCFVPLGLLEITAQSDGEGSIGNNVASTILFAVGSCAFWLMVSSTGASSQPLYLQQCSQNNYYFYKVLELSINQVNMFGDLHKGPLLAALRILRRVFVSNTLLCSSACLSGIGFLLVPNSEQIFASIHYFVLGFATFTNVLVLQVAVRPLIIQLEIVIKLTTTDAAIKAKIESARDAFKAHLSDISNPLPLHFVIAVLFGAVPVLTRKSCYWVPIAWTLASISIVPVMNAWNQPKILEMISNTGRSADKVEPKQESIDHSKLAAQEIVVDSKDHSESHHIS